MRLSWLWPAINLFTTFITSVIVFGVPMTPLQSYVTPLQPFIVMGFLLFCPGMALVRFLRLNDLAVELSLAVALSLSVASIVAGAFLYAKYWSLLDMLTVLVLLTFICSAAQIIMQLPLVGLARRQEQADDIAATATASLASIQGAAQKLPEVTKENTPQPAEMAPGRVRKDTWDLEKAATTIMPAVAHPQAVQSIEKVATTIMPAASNTPKKDIEKTATTIMPAASNTPKKDIEKTATTLLPAASDVQKKDIEKTATTLLPAASNALKKDIEKTATTLLPAAHEPHKKEIEKAATTIMPAAPNTPKKDIEKTATTLLPAAPVQSQSSQSIAEKGTTLPSATSRPSSTQKIEEKDTTHMPLAAGTQSTPEIEEGKKKAPSTPPIAKQQVASAIEEKQAPLATSTARSTDALEDDEEDNTDKVPVVRRKKLQKDARDDDRDTDVNLKSEDFSTPAPGETPNPMPALSSPTVTKNVLRKRRLLNQ